MNVYTAGVWLNTVGRTRLKPSSQWINPIGEREIPMDLIRFPDNHKWEPGVMRDGYILEVDHDRLQVCWTSADARGQETMHTAWINPENTQPLGE
tara:strand:+ start:883 stop:1167 length:285 start_codon:yes stop_codon:yes gene_type:complete